MKMLIDPKRISTEKLISNFEKNQCKSQRDIFVIVDLIRYPKDISKINFDQISIADIDYAIEVFEGYNFHELSAIEDLNWHNPFYQYCRLEEAVLYLIRKLDKQYEVEDDFL